jgi:hypothetical protein
MPRLLQRLVRLRPRYGPETWVTVTSRDMGHSLMLVVGTPGGARCPGDTPHPWTRRPNASPMTCEEHCRSQRGAHGTASVVRRATSGSSASSQPVHRVWRIARANHAPAPLRRRSTSSTPSSNCAVGILRGAPRHGGRSCKHVNRAGRCPGAPRSATSCAALAWYRRHDTLATSATPATRPR